MDPAQYGTRADGTQKGLGWFGEIKTKDGKALSTELGAGVEVDGKEIQFPLINPMLTKEEIDFLVNGGEPNDEIFKKSIDWAMQRIKAGKSPFAAPGEQMPMPRSAQEEFDAGFKGVKR
jgi:hypothetical protein